MEESTCGDSFGSLDYWESLECSCVYVDVVIAVIVMEMNQALLLAHILMKAQVNVVGFAVDQHIIKINITRAPFLIGPCLIYVVYVVLLNVYYAVPMDSDPIIVDNVIVRL